LRVTSVPVSFLKNGEEVGKGNVVVFTLLDSADRAPSTIRRRGKRGTGFGGIPMRGEKKIGEEQKMESLSSTMERERKDLMRVSKVTSPIEVRD